LLDRARDVRRRFSADSPDRLWMTDIPEHPTREGKIYCCAVIDTFSRMVVGWSIDSSQTGLLVTNALGMALKAQDPARGRDHPLRPGGSVRLLGLQPEGHRRASRAVGRRRRRSVR
jgi:transposase InsO family protein